MNRNVRLYAWWLLLMAGKKKGYGPILSKFLQNFYFRPMYWWPKIWKLWKSIPILVQNLYFPCVYYFKTLMCALPRHKKYVYKIKRKSFEGLRLDSVRKKEGVSTPMHDRFWRMSSCASRSLILAMLLLTNKNTSMFIYCISVEFNNNLLWSWAVVEAQCRRSCVRPIRSSYIYNVSVRFTRR